MRRTLVVLTLAGAVAGCHGRDPVAPQGGSLAGTYRLATYDGRRLPATADVVGGQARQVLAGSLVLNPNGTCSTSETVVRTEQGVSATEVSVGQCTYSVVGTDRLDLRLESGSVQIATFAEGVVAYGDFFVFREYRRVDP